MENLFKFYTNNFTAAYTYNGSWWHVVFSFYLCFVIVFAFIFVFAFVAENVNRMRWYLIGKYKLKAALVGVGSGAGRCRDCVLLAR